MGCDKHGYTACVCPVCDEIEALRAQVAALKGCVPELPEPLYAGNHLPRFGIRWNGPTEPLCVPMDDGYWTPWHYAKAKLADCQDVIRDRGHEIWCGSNNCGHLYAGGFCGIGRDAHGPNGAVHEFIARHGCTCGYDRVMGEG